MSANPKATAHGTVWQAVPVAEIDLIAHDLMEVSATTKGVLRDGLQARINSQIDRLNHARRMAPYYNQTAGLPEQGTAVDRLTRIFEVAYDEPGPSPTMRDLLSYADPVLPGIARLGDDEAVTDMLYEFHCSGVELREMAEKVVEIWGLYDPAVTRPHEVPSHLTDHLIDGHPLKDAWTEVWKPLERFDTDIPMEAAVDLLSSAGYTGEDFDSIGEETGGTACTLLTMLFIRCPELMDRLVVK